MTQAFPTVLTELKEEDTIDMNFAELIDHCKGIEAVISVTHEQDVVAAMRSLLRICS